MDGRLLTRRLPFTLEIGFLFGKRSQVSRVGFKVSHQRSLKDPIYGSTFL